MIAFIKKHISLFIQISLLVLMIIFLIVLNVLKTNSDIAESWTRGIGSVYASIAGFLTSWIPFSFTELSFVALAAFIIIFIIKIIKKLIKKEIISVIVKALVIANSIVGLILVYNFSCELAYNRKPVDLPYYQEKVEKNEYKDIYNYFTDDLNYCIDSLEFSENGDVNTSLSIRDISSLVEESYKIITSDYFNNSTAHAKPMLSSFIYRELQITGVTFAPFAEANVDYLATKVELPFVVAHELAHTKGVMREDDANQVAFYVCLNSDNTYLRYSAYSLYFYQIRVMSSKTYMSQEDRDQLTPINATYSKTTSYLYNYWKEHDLMGNIGEWINNMYITSSGIKEGTESYSGGTEVIEDPTTHDLVPNKYQKLFFENYYRNK